ncbi:MAG: chromosome partitioning protein ParB, partial [Hyphomicrobiaceae bacterium]
MHLLTLAARERQAAWLALVRDPDQDAPPPWQLKAWLLGGAEIACDAALFDEADYQGAIAADLFGDTRYFTDSEAFWHLQNQAIAAERDRLLEAGWADVHVVPPDQRFQHWDYDKTSKSKGGAVYLDVEPDGRVTIHKGLVPRAELRRSANSAIRDDGQPCSTRGERPELSAPLANYVDLVRHSAVRLALTGAAGIALRLMLAHAIGGGRWWQVKAEPQRPATTAIAEAVDALPSQAAFLERRKEVMALLDLDPDDTALVSHDGSGDRTANVFARLLGMPDVSVMQVLAVVMAET